MSHSAFLAYSIYTSAIWRRRVISKCRASPGRAQSGRTPELATGPKASSLNNLKIPSKQLLFQCWQAVFNFSIYFPLWTVFETLCGHFCHFPSTSVIKYSSCCVDWLWQCKLSTAPPQASKPHGWRKGWWWRVPKHYKHYIISGRQNKHTKNGVQMLKTPSFGLHVGHSLKKCAMIKMGRAVRLKDTVMRAEAQDFHLLAQAEWTDTVSSPALQTLREREYYTEAEIPETADLIKLNAYTNMNIKEQVKCLHENASKENWFALFHVMP